MVAYAIDGDIYINYLEINEDGDDFEIIKRRESDTNIEFEKTMTYYMEDIKNYDYVGYTIVNKNVKTTSKQKGLNRSEKVIVQVNTANPVKSINFLYKKKTGTVKVRNIMLYADNTYKEIPGHTKIYDNLEITTHTYKPTYSSNTSKYIGYVLEDGLVSTKDYTLRANKYKSENEVSVKLKEDENEKILTFVYFEERFDDLGIGIDFTHWDLEDDTGIFPTDRITREFADISDFLNTVYANNTNKANIAKEYNSIVHSDITLDEKLAKILELINKDWNENVLALKSFNTTNQDFSRYKFYGIEIGTKKSKSFYEVDFEDTDNGIQVYPKLKDIIKVVEKRSFFESTDAPKLIIKFLYESEAIINIKYENGDEHTPKHGVTTPLLKDSTKNIKMDKSCTIDIPEVPGYVFKDFKATFEGGKIEGNKIITPNIKNANETITLYYYAPHTVTVNLKNLATNLNIEYPTTLETEEYIQNPYTYIDVEYDSNIHHTINNIIKDSGFIATYDREKTKATYADGTIANININIIDDSIDITNITNDVNIDIYYSQSRDVKVRYVDIDDKQTVISEEKVAVEGNSNTTTVTARSSIKGRNGNYVYADSYEVTPAGLQGTSNKVTVSAKDDTVVTFYCKKAVQVTINYFDASTGKKLGTSKTTNLNNGDNYSYKVENKDGYSYSYYTTSESSKKQSSRDITYTKLNESQVINIYYNPRAGFNFQISGSQERNQLVDREKYTKYEALVLDEIFSISIDVGQINNNDTEKKIYVKFPFDVYYIEGGLTTGTGKFISAGSEIYIDTLQKGMNYNEQSYTYLFRLPSWIVEKDYVDSISLLIKEDDKITDTITDSASVIGTLYGFSVTNLAGDTDWKTSIFEGKNAGTKYTASMLPIGQRDTLTSTNVKLDTQGENENGIKLGSRFLFNVSTKGLKTNRISITPKLTFVTYSGEIKNDVTYKYKVSGGTEEEFAIQDGVITAKGIARQSYLYTTLNNEARNTSEVTKEIEKANSLSGAEYVGSSAKKDYANVLNAYNNFSSTETIQFGTFASLLIDTGLRTPNVNYISKEVKEIGEKDDILRYIDSSDTYASYISKASKVSIEENQIINSLSHWYAEYKLPASLKAMKYLVVL